MFVETEEYLVEIETTEGNRSIPVIAESVIDMYEQVTEEDDFIRIVNIK